MVVICLLLRRMPSCLACVPTYVGGDSFKSAVSTVVFGFQSWILAGFVSEFFNLDFGKIQNATVMGFFLCSMLSSSPINDGGRWITAESNFETSGSSVSNTFLSTK
ncbi:Uncharacterized protein Fot_04873 [Forsythia ovata]|uniref:Uncharacterized protein n=1 Tax=Forsythia ovata TaxID=205694 RepID=A0ABD1WNK7_9LAMI